MQAVNTSTAAANLMNEMDGVCKTQVLAGLGLGLGLALRKGLFNNDTKLSWECSQKPRGQRPIKVYLYGF